MHRVSMAAIAASLILFASQAAAAPVAYNWTGYYVGANAGYGWGNWEPSSNFPVFSGTSYFFPPNSGFVETWDCASFNGPFCNGNASVHGALGGLQGGYNWQSGQWVYGVEADLQATGLKKTLDATVSYTGVAIGGFCDSTVGTNPCKITTSNDYKLPWLATVRGRLGYASNDWLLYATGGLAVGEAKSSFTFTENQGANVSLTVQDSVVKFALPWAPASRRRSAATGR
jgi:outer membrane immunogenic protein